MVAQKTAAKKAASVTKKATPGSKKATAQSGAAPATKATASEPAVLKKAAPTKKVVPAKKIAPAKKAASGTDPAAKSAPPASATKPSAATKTGPAAKHAAKTTAAQKPVTDKSAPQKTATKKVATKKAVAKKATASKVLADPPENPEATQEAAPKAASKPQVKSGRAARGQKQDKYVPIKKNVPLKTGTTTANPTSRAPVAPVQHEPPSEPVFNESDLAEFKVLIDHELAQIQGEYDQAVAALNAAQSSNLDSAGDDPADAGNKTFEREQAMSIAQNRMDLITQMERALYRIRIGSYGVCESCATTIPKARLQAYPAATLCVACKAREERR
ncbi:MAG: TraR/DksA C4-type zinc finger protein [Antricoccus sp.]